MAITEQCKAAMIEHGVFMTKTADGREVPAGMALLAQPKLSVALISADENGEYPGGFDPDRYPLPLDHYEPGVFPDGFETVARDALKYFYAGDVEFVGLKDLPDVVIFATQNGLYSGIATLPENTHEEYSKYGYQYPVIGLSVKLGWRDQPVTENELFETLQHESGHALAGIHHPAFAKDEIEKQALENKLESHACSGEGQEVEIDKILDFGSQGALMSMGSDGQENWYDSGARDFTRTGILPLGIKP